MVAIRFGQISCRCGVRFCILIFVLAPQLRGNNVVAICLSCDLGSTWFSGFTPEVVALEKRLGARFEQVRNPTSLLFKTWTPCRLFTTIQSWTAPLFCKYKLEAQASESFTSNPLAGASCLYYRHEMPNLALSK